MSGHLKNKGIKIKQILLLLMFAGGFACVTVDRTAIDHPLIEDRYECYKQRYSTSYVDNKGNIWIIADVGIGDFPISKYNDGKWSIYNSKSQLIPVIFEDHYSNVWIKNNSHGISKFDGIAWTRYEDISDIGMGGFSFGEDSKGNLWYVSAKILAQFKDGKWVIHHQKGLLDDEFLLPQTITGDRKGNIWVATWHNVKKYNGITWTDYKLKKTSMLDYLHIHKIIEDMNSNLWIAGQSCAIKFDGNKWTAYTPSYLAEKSDVIMKTYQDFDESKGIGPMTHCGECQAEECESDIIVDRNGNIWFTTKGGKIISEYNGRDWIDHSKTTGLTSYYNYDDGIFKSFLAPSATDHCATRGNCHETEGLYSSSSLFRFWEDIKGNIWYANPKNIRMFDGGKWISFMKGERVNDIGMDFQRKNIFVNSNVGVFKFDGSNFEPLPLPKILNGYAEDLKTDSEGNLWLFKKLPNKDNFLCKYLP